MDVYTLVGKSGTGKSLHAMNLCKKLDIEAIIDDGLFIYKNTVIAGTSAKREATKIGAVKVALFNNDEIRYEVASAIKEKNPSSILILGTSDGMVDRIIKKLGLPEIPQDSLRRIRITTLHCAISIKHHQTIINHPINFVGFRCTTHLSRTL